MDKVIITLVVILIVLLFMVFTARARIKRLYKKYLTVGNSANMTGKDLAEMSVESLNLPHLNLALTSTDLGDAYLPKTKTLLLSNAVCNYPSLSSLAIVAHELGHAVQDRQNHRLFGLSIIFERITRFTNKFVLPLLLGGLTLFGLGHFNIVASNLKELGITLSFVAFGLFLLHFIVKLITIPIEYDASKKALLFLKDYRLLNKTEIRQVKRLLNAAAQTYIASLFDGFIIASKRIGNFVNRKSNKQVKKNKRKK